MRNEPGRRNPTDPKPSFDRLPLEVILEILYKLPVKALVKCTSVCKSWSSLIKDPDFISTHLERALCSSKTNKKTDPLILLHHFPNGLIRYTLRFGTRQPKYGETLFPSFEFCEKELKRRSQFLSLFFHEQNEANLEVIGSCNGLVCLGSIHYDSILLWNPLTKRTFTLPKAPLDTYIHLKFMGFGFDYKTNDYKVMKVSQYGDRTHTFTYMQIYSLKSNCWKCVDYPVVPDFQLWLLFGPLVFGSGSLHSFAYKEGNVNSSFIVGFEVSDGAFREIVLPESLQVVDTDLLYILGYGGGSSIAVGYSPFDEDFGYGCCEVWVMKTYDVVATWTKLLMVKDVIYNAKILGFRKNEVLVERSGEGCFPDAYYDDQFVDREMVLDCLGRGIVSINPGSKQSKFLRKWRLSAELYPHLDYEELELCDPEDSSSINTSVYSYIESLALFDVRNDARDDGSTDGSVSTAKLS